MKNDMAWYLLTVALSPLIVFLLQAILIRSMRGRSPQLLTMASMVVSFPFFSLMVFQFPFEREKNFEFWLYLSLLYAFTTYTYFHVFNMSETSRRVRMLAAIALRNLRDVNSISEIYDEDQMIRVRLGRLIALGQIQEKKGLYYPRGRFFPLLAFALYCLTHILGRPWEPMRRWDNRHI